jgi:hypothetical protein
MRLRKLLLSSVSVFQQALLVLVLATIAGVTAVAQIDRACSGAR